MALSKSFKLLSLLMVGALLAAKASAQVIVTLQATGLTSSSFSPRAFATGIGSGVGTFTVSRSGSTTGAVTINLSASGTAVAGVDYVAFPTNMTLAANVVSSNLTVALQSGVSLSTAKTVVLTLLTN